MGAIRRCKHKIGLLLGATLLLIGSHPTGCSLMRGWASMITHQPRIEVRFMSPYRKDFKEAWSAIFKEGHPHPATLESLQERLRSDLPLGTSMPEFKAFVKKHFRDPEANTEGPFIFGHHAVIAIKSPPKATLLDISYTNLKLMIGFKEDQLTEISLSLGGFKGSTKTFKLLTPHS